MITKVHLWLGKKWVRVVLIVVSVIFIIAFVVDDSRRIWNVLGLAAIWVLIAVNSVFGRIERETDRKEKEETYYSAIRYLGAAYLGYWRKEFPISELESAMNQTLQAAKALAATMTHQEAEFFFGDPGGPQPFNSSIGMTKLNTVKKGCLRITLAINGSFGFEGSIQLWDEAAN